LVTWDSPSASTSPGWRSTLAGQESPRATKPAFCKTLRGRCNQTHSVAAGLDYIGVGPTLAYLYHIDGVGSLKHLCASASGAPPGAPKHHPRRRDSGAGCPPLRQNGRVAMRTACGMTFLSSPQRRYTAAAVESIMVPVGWLHQAWYWPTQIPLCW